VNRVNALRYLNTLFLRLRLSRRLNDVLVTFMSTSSDLCHRPTISSTYLLTVIDRFTSRPEAWPLENMSAHGVAQLLTVNWIARFGVPDIITTDQGRQFFDMDKESEKRVLIIIELLCNFYL